MTNAPKARAPSYGTAKKTTAKEAEVRSSAATVSARMRLVRTRDTGPEIAVRRLLHRMGLRYRLQRRVLPGQRIRPDIDFPTEKVAVLVHGCFWHGCALHASWPVANAEWWRRKIQGNQARDRETEELLRSSGWAVVVVWEHDNPSDAAGMVAEIVRRRRPQRPQVG